MASIIQEIQVVRSIRKDLRDVLLPINILNSIDSIHNCIKTGTDLNGWKKVDWRGSSSGNSGHGSVQGSGSSGGYRANGGSGGSSFFINRNGGGSGANSSNGVSNANTREYQTREAFSSSMNYTFCNRTKNGGRTIDTSVSIPLVSNLPVNNSSNMNVSQEGFRTPPPKYVSKFRKSSEKVDDTILNTIILGKLNKFSEQNYDEIKEFITHIIDNGQTDMIKCFMKLVFEKAASEEMFCPLYAKLLSELSSRYPLLLTEMGNLYSQYMEIFDEVTEDSAINYNEVCKRNVEKKYRRGYSQFLAELIKHDVIDTEVFMKTVNKIISQVQHTSKLSEQTKLNEEFGDCLMKIMKAIQTDTKQEFGHNGDSNSIKIETIRTNIKDETSKNIKPFTVRNTEMKGISNKARFTFLDIYDGIQKF